MSKKVLRKRIKKKTSDISRYKKSIRGKKINRNSIVNKYVYNKSIESEYRKNDNKLRVVQYVIGIFIVILGCFLFFILNIPKIRVDNDYQRIEYNGEYNYDYSAYNYFDDYTDKVIVNDKVDVSKVGTYYIDYSLKYGFLNVNERKKIEVVDSREPEIILNGSSEVVMCPSSKYSEEGYRAYDEYDGDITDKVNVSVFDDRVEYLVKDSSLNEHKVVREIKYEDKESPKIELVSSNITLYRGEGYVETGYKAYDNCDGDITSKVSVTNNVNVNKIGVYEVKYSVLDSSGNSSSVVRRVSVIERKVVNSNGKGVIYLTFDDGPSNLTNSILDILKNEGVKATFFVTGNVDSYRNILSREYNEGHTIGLHTYSHDYKYLYSNKSNFFSDLDKINNSIYNIIGKKSNIIRFPGGSSNTISRNYSKGIMSYLTVESINRGYNYFDWNIDSNDAGSDINNSNRIYYNVVNNLNPNGINVILMHDSYTHSATVKALSNIISFGKENGYLFKGIDNNTSYVRHKVNN